MQSLNLTKERFDEIRKKIEKKNSIFLDKRYLDSLYLPSSIIGREREAEQLLQYVDSFKQGFVVPLVSVYGRSGSGKSTLVKFVCDNITDVASSVFVNLRKSKTVFGCANRILSELGGESLKSSEGLNKAIDCMEKRIEEILQKEGKKFFVLVLDEYDVISSDIRSRPSDFVYKLLILEENLRKKGFMICLVTISNNALSDHELDDRVKSRMGTGEVFFNPYSEHDVYGILKDRASKAFRIPIEDDILQYCAKLSSDDHGDARRALDLLRTAGETCDGKITKPDLDKAQEKLYKDRISTVVSSVSYHPRVLIGAICEISYTTKISWVPTSSIFEKYQEILAKDKKPLSYRRISDLLVEIENSGLVTSRTMSHGRYGYGKEYKLVASPEFVGPFVAKDWWENIVESKKREDAFNDMIKGFGGTTKKSSILETLLRKNV